MVWPLSCHITWLGLVGGLGSGGGFGLGSGFGLRWVRVPHHLIRVGVGVGVRVPVGVWVGSGLVRAPHRLA